MSGISESCTHCGKHGVSFKRCSVCKKASYCGPECQNANWKRHKKTCAPPPPKLHIDRVFEKVKRAHLAGDWREVLTHEGRMEELLVVQLDSTCQDILAAFAEANKKKVAEIGFSNELLFLVVSLEKRRVEVLGRMQRFRDQGELMCFIGGYLHLAGQREEAKKCLNQARDVGAAHGFFSVECQSCMELGAIAMKEGHHEEGVAMLRNALAAAPLVEDETDNSELHCLKELIDALFKINALAELETLVPRFREVAKAKSRQHGRR